MKIKHIPYSVKQTLHTLQSLKEMSSISGVLFLLLTICYAIVIGYNRINVLFLFISNIKWSTLYVTRSQSAIVQTLTNFIFEYSFPIYLNDTRSSPAHHLVFFVSGKHLYVWGFVSEKQAEGMQLSVRRSRLTVNHKLHGVIKRDRPRLISIYIVHRHITGRG